MDRQKNRNILRRLIFCSSAFLLFCFTSCDREEMIVNKRWHLNSVLMNGEPYNDSTQFNIIPKYTYYYFSYLNVLEVSTLVDEQPVISANGKYFFKDRSTLELEFTLKYQKYKIDSVNIVKLNNKEMNLEYDFKGNTYFLKFFSRS